MMNSDQEPSKLTKVLIHKTHGGRKKDSKFWNDDIYLDKKTDLNIAIESPKKRKNRRYNKSWLIPPSIVLLIIVVLVIARPDLFPFLNYHDVYKVVERIDNTIDGKIQGNESKVIPIPKKQLSSLTSDNPRKKNTHKAPSYSSRQQLPQVSSNGRYTGNDISLSGMVFSWKDNEGKRHFSNMNYPKDNPTLQVQTEINTYRKITKVSVSGNQIYVPVTLRNNGLSTTMWMLLDTGCSHTNVPYSKLNKIKAKYGRTVRSTIANGSTTTGREAYIDMIQVGSQKERNVRVTGSKVAGSSNSGLLGLDFLKRRPFKIDYGRQMLVWM